MNTLKKVLFYSRDPGGANCVVPVYRKLSKTKGIKVELWGKDFAIRKYREDGLRYRDIGILKKDDIRNLLNRFRPEILVTGTSYGDRMEQWFWKTAGKLGIYSTAILDQWLSYRVRFSDPSGRLALPDKILVMDEFAKQEMVAEGFDQRRILVTGQPHFEVLESKASQITETEKRKIGKVFNLGGGITILFVSEPIGAVSRVDTGFTEHTIIRELIIAIRQMEPLVTVNLLVKLHPKQNISGMRQTIGLFPAVSNIHVSIIADQPLLPFILVADIVVGMCSMGLIEAHLLKKPIVSIQIGRKGPDQFILSKRGIIEAITTSDALRKELRSFFLLPEKRSQKTFPVIPHPVENVKRFIISVFDQQ